MKKIFKLGLVGATLIPVITFAQTKDLKWLVGEVVNYFNVAIQLIIAFAVLMFVFNVYRYFISGGENVEKKKEAGMYVLWSVIGFFVILSVWGLVNILLTTFKLNNNAPSSGFFPQFINPGGSSGSDLPPSVGHGTNTGGSVGGGTNTGGSVGSGTNSNNVFNQMGPQ